MRYERRSISPADAERMLANNYDGNRRINSRHVAALAADMAAGRFVSENSQTITVTESGQLLDGQHRLSAIVKAGVALDFLVAVARDDEAERIFGTLDAGKVRTAPQFLALPSANNVAAVAKMTLAIERGRSPLASTVNGKMESIGHSGALYASRVELLEYIDENADALVDAVRIGSRMREGIGCGSIALYATFIRFVRWLEADDLLDIFIDDVCALVPSQPIVAALRRRLVKECGTLKCGTVKHRATTLRHLLCAYAHYCADDGSKDLRGEDKAVAQYERMMYRMREKIAEAADA